jgi:hypothetical protein
LLGANFVASVAGSQYCGWVAGIKSLTPSSFSRRVEGEGHLYLAFVARVELPGRFMNFIPKLILLEFTKSRDIDLS